MEWCDVAQVCLTSLPALRSAGGGQMATCRQIARAGQLILNGGKWVGGQGGETVVQLLDEQYAKQMLRPAKPGAVEGYGFLAWLNADMAPARPGVAPRSHCCGPRWIGRIAPPLGKRQCVGELCGTCCASDDFPSASRPTPSYEWFLRRTQ